MSRFTIEFSSKIDKDLDKMAKNLGVSTKEEVIRKALDLLYFVVQEQQHGGIVVIEDKKRNVRKQVVKI